MSDDGPPARGLLGRREDIAWIVEFVEQARNGGGSALLSGAPGIGKSALLGAAADAAGHRLLPVLRAEGVEFESKLPYAALNQLLHPILDELDAIEPALQEALVVALGLRSGAAPSPPAVADATIALLERVAGDTAVVAVVDDVQWVDRPSAVVLGMVARRTAATRIGLLMATRSGLPTLLSSMVRTERIVQSLTGAEARDLVRREQPALTHFVRERLLQVAGGNPLALIELGTALARDPDATIVSSSTLPLSRRLRELYADRVRCLPERAGRLLLAAALEPSCNSSILRSVAGGLDAVAELAPAVQDNLVEVDHATAVRFTHPLVRSAVVALADLDEQARCHRLLAAALVDDPVRRAWHLGQAAIGPDEDLASLLDVAAPEVLARGNAGGAIAAMTRAADLSVTAGARARRLARAAWLGVCMTGDSAIAKRLLAAAQATDPSVGDALSSAAVLPYLAVDGGGDVDTVHALLSKLYREIDFVDPPSELGAVLDAHKTLAVCTARTDIWDSHADVLTRLGVRARTSDVLFSVFARGPVAPKLALLDDLDAAVAGLADTDDMRDIVTISSMAVLFDRSEPCRAALERVLRLCGEDATFAMVWVGMELLGRSALDRGDWSAADAILGDARAQVNPGTHLGWILDAAAGTLAARQGRTDEVARACTALAERATVGQVVHTLHDAVRAEEALGLAEWARGYDLLRGVMPVDDPFGELATAPFHTLDFAEAAWNSGRVAEASAHVAVMVDAGCARLSSRVALITTGAQAVVTADHEEAAALFERVLGGPDADRWPWERARIQLAHGRRLRRARDPRAARVPLAEALRTFQRLGASPWATQTTAELRAARDGAARYGRASSALTVQELTIAELAARGLTNKQIAAELTLSPRTISTHLRRIFAKLGVTNRAGLRVAMGGAAG